VVVVVRRDGLNRGPHWERSGLPEKIVDEDGVGGQVEPYNVVDGRGPMAW
jgi:hypothetical protein